MCRASGMYISGRWGETTLISTHMLYKLPLILRLKTLGLKQQSFVFIYKTITLAGFSEDSLSLLHIVSAGLTQQSLDDMLPKWLILWDVGAELVLPTRVLVLLHMGPSAWVSSRHRGWFKSTCSQVLGGSCKTSYNLASEVPDVISLWLPLCGGGVILFICIYLWLVYFWIVAKWINHLFQCWCSLRISNLGFPSLPRSHKMRKKTTAQITNK